MVRVVLNAAFNAKGSPSDTRPDGTMEDAADGAICDYLVTVHDKSTFRILGSDIIHLHLSIRPEDLKTIQPKLFLHTFEEVIIGGKTAD